MATVSNSMPVGGNAELDRVDVYMIINGAFLLHWVVWGKMKNFKKSPSHVVIMRMNVLTDVVMLFLINMKMLACCKCVPDVVPHKEQPVTGN